MSLKVYNAFRARKGVDVWSLVRDIRPRGEAEVKKALRRVYAGVMSGVSVDSPEYIERAPKVGDAQARLAVARDILRANYREQATSGTRDPFDFDVSIAFREWEGRVYLIKRCDMLMSRCLDFLDADPRLKEYHYQNQADRPEEISAREWRERRAVWEPMTNREPWRNVLVLHLCEWSSWHLIDPWMDMASELAAKEKA